MHALSHFVPYAQSRNARDDEKSFKRFEAVLISLSIIVGTLLFLPSAGADQLLPYGQRHRAYSGYQPTVRGDNETVGMAGATVAIPNSVSSLETNPAGLTMTMGNVTAQLNSNEMTDRELTATDREKVRSSQWGLTATPNEWGFAISSYSPSFEGGRYISPNTGNARQYEISSRQFRFTASRAFLKKQLSIGASLELNRAIRKINDMNDGSNGVSFMLGAIYHVKKHFLVGASYSPRQELGGSIPTSGGNEMIGFSQPIRSPMILNLGVGWLPNRFFSAGAAVVAVGSTENTALFKDENVTVGDHFTLQPRLGAAYVLGQYDNLKVTAAGGAYYETSRTQGRSNRLHGTFALQASPYFVNAGIGIDRAKDYDNFFVSIGFDVVRTLRVFGIIPRDSVPAYHGILPPAFEIQADGLPDGLTQGEDKEFESPSVSDVKQIIENIPQNIENKLEGKPSVQEQKEKADEQKPQSKKKKRSKKRMLKEKDKSIYPAERA